MAFGEISGSQVLLREFSARDISSRYLGWLSDPIVNKYSRRSMNLEPVTKASAEAYLESLGADERILAIEMPQHGHVGNVKYGPIDRANRRADISILIGEQSTWGKGVGAEAVYLVSRYLFQDEEVNRIEAGSANPAFIALVSKLGWKTEGCLRQYVQLTDGFYDWTLLSLLKSEFQQINRFETDPCSWSS